MKIDVNITGLAETRATLRNFSERRMQAAVATGLTRTAGAIRASWAGELIGKLDRPTAGTVGSVRVIQATAQKPTATVFIRDKASKPGTIAPAQWLAPQEGGGGRFIKKFERALQAQGSMPPGTKVVPGRYASIDSYGNISRGQIVQVIAQLGKDFSPGYQRVISKTVEGRLKKAQRTGRTYVAVVKRTGKLKPGVYMRGGPGMKALLPVFFYVASVGYRKRIDLEGKGGQVANAQLSGEIERALQESIVRLSNKSTAA